MPLKDFLGLNAVPISPERLSSLIVHHNSQIVRLRQILDGHFGIDRTELLDGFIKLPGGLGVISIR